MGKEDIEEYNLILSIVVNKFECEYAWCWSHQQILECNIDLQDIQKLYNDIKKIKWIKL